MKIVMQYTVVVLNIALWGFLRRYTEVQHKLTSLGPVPKIDSYYLKKIPLQVLFLL